MSFDLVVAPSAERDLEKLPEEVSREIRRFLQGPLRRDPYHAGTPLGVLGAAPEPRGRGRDEDTGAFGRGRGRDEEIRAPRQADEVPSATMFEAKEGTWRVLYRIDRNTRTVRVTVISHRPPGGRRLPESATSRIPFVDRFR
jgi:mRNA-degrading endonuclease RelE of RelBE toxin-antitoxin system